VKNGSGSRSQGSRAIPFKHNALEMIDEQIRSFSPTAKLFPFQKRMPSQSTYHKVLKTSMCPELI
jgi:hypothetical protein